MDRKKTIENLKKIQKAIDESKRKDCAEYGDCHCDPAISGCPANCSAYNKSSSEDPKDLRRCDCGTKEDPEIAHVTYAHWAVLCHECGALGKPGREKSSAVEKWDEGKLQRECGYFTSGQYTEECIKMGRQIAGLE